MTDARHHRSFACSHDHSWAQEPPLHPQLPGPFTSTVSRAITAPNGGVVYDKALEAANKSLVHGADRRRAR